MASNGYAAEWREGPSGTVEPPGTVVTLSKGECHYVEVCPEGLPPASTPVLLVHGIIGSHVYFRYLAIALGARRRVIVPDLYGRGFSGDASQHRMGSELFVEQLAELLDALGLEEVDLIGVSMGGAISLAFAAEHPKKTHSLTLLAPAGMPSCKPSCVATSLASVPCLSSAVCSVLVALYFRHPTGEFDFPEGDRAKEMAAFERKRKPFESTLPRAFARCVRDFPLGDLSDAARRVGEHCRSKGLRVFVCWGELDKVVPFAGLAELRTLVPALQAHVFQTSRHSFFVDRAEEVAAMVLEFHGEGSGMSKANASE